VSSHSTCKAALQEGHGHIPSVNDRSNTESAFLQPYVASARFPNSINDLTDQALSHEEWVAFLTYLPTKEAMQETSDIRLEMAEEALEKLSELEQSHAWERTFEAEVVKAKWLEGRYCGSRRPRIWIGVTIAILSSMSHTCINVYSINRLGMRGV
jgi:hypothetical protein